jgi:hypothetical protein
MLLIRILVAALGIALLCWAYAILDNIWNYNDSGTLAYIVFAAIPGIPGLVLLHGAVRPRRSPTDAASRPPNVGTPET